MSLDVQGEAPPQVNEPSSAFDTENHDSSDHDAAPATTPVKPFRFMGLPAEIREKVYQLASPAPIKSTRISVGAYTTAKPIRYALAQASRTTREEALAVYFSKTEFEIRISSRRRFASHGWVDAQDEFSVSSMRNIVLLHRSWADHGEERHRAEINVNMVKGTVCLQQKDFQSCNKCIEDDVVSEIVERIQKVVDGIEAVDGRKRLTKSLLDSIIRLAHGMCRP